MTRTRIELKGSSDSTRRVGEGENGYRVGSGRSSVYNKVTSRGGDLRDSIKTGVNTRVE